MSLSFTFEKLLVELSDELERCVQPLMGAVRNPIYFYRFLHQIGWDVDSLMGVNPMVLAGNFLKFSADLKTALSALQNSEEFDQVGPNIISAIKALDSLISDLQTLSESLTEFITQGDNHRKMLITELAGDIAEHLLMRYLAGRAPTLFALGILFGLIHGKRVTPLYTIANENSLEDNIKNGVMPLRFPLAKLGINYRGIKNPFVLPISAMLDSLDSAALSSPEAFFATLQSTLSEKLDEIARAMQQRGMGELVIFLDLEGIGISLENWLPTMPEGTDSVVIPFYDKTDSTYESTAENPDSFELVPKLIIGSKMWRFNWFNVEDSEEIPIMGEFLYLLKGFSSRFSSSTNATAEQSGIKLTITPSNSNNTITITFEINIGLKLVLNENQSNEISLSLNLHYTLGDNNVALQLAAKVHDELVIPVFVPGLTGMALGIEEPRARAELKVVDENYALLFNLSVAGFTLQLPTELFKRAVEKEDDSWELEPGSAKVIFTLADANEITTQELLSVRLGTDTDNQLPTISELTLLKPSGKLMVETDGAIFIGLDNNPDKGFIIEIDRFEYNFSDDFDSLVDGLHISRAIVHLPQVIPLLDELILEQASFTDAGFSGKISVLFNHDAENPELLFGVLPIEFYSLELEFRENIPIEFKIQAAIKLPYFDEWVEVTLGINDSFDVLFHIESNNPNGTTLTKEELLSLTFRSAAFDYQRNSNLLKLSLSGGLEPLLWNADGLEWPRLDIKNLSLEQNLQRLPNGNFNAPVLKFEEAWLDLKDLATLDLFGFHFELNRIGVGYVDATDKMWLDLTGSLRLIDQIPIGLGVEGFRLTWPRSIYEELGVNHRDLTIEDVLRIASNIEVKFDGVYLFYGIPQAVEFEGHIRFIKEAQKVGFAGDMALRVPATGLAIEAGLMVGMNFEDPPYPFLYVYFGIILPAGIPLGQSGLALKGAKGMFGLNVEPNREPEQNPYYDWYKREPEGAHPTNKWRDQIWSIAFGAGITITTADGKILGVQGLLVLVIPGPIIMIEGKALVFDGLFPEDGPLKAMAYFDGNEETVQLNIEAAMELVEGVIDINAGLEAFFDFNNFYNWHLYLGKNEPKERRIHANILKIPAVGWLFEGNCYLMLDMVGDTFRSRLGVYIGFEPPALDLVVASAKLKAVIEGDGVLTINPFQFKGDIELDAILDVKAFGFNVVGVEASAGVAVEGALPLLVDAHVFCHVDLPIPDLEDVPVVGDWVSDAVNWFEEEVAELPDIPEYIEFEVPFRWEFDGPPVIDPLVKDIAVESYFVQGGGSIMSSKSKKSEILRLLHSQVVPLDAKPTIIFDQHVNQPESFDFAGYISEDVKIFMSGKIAFKPLIKDIVLYQLPKDKFRSHVTSQHWEEVGRASDNKLWGIYRPEPKTDLELKTDGKENASRRILRLWSTNAFDFVNGFSVQEIPGNELIVNDPEEDTSISFFVRQFNDNSKLAIYSNRKSKKECIGESILKNGFEQKVVPKLVRRGNHYKKQLTLKKVSFESLDLAVGYDSKEKAYYIGSGSLGTEPILRICFPETVVWAEIKTLDKFSSVGVDKFSTFTKIDNRSTVDTRFDIQPPNSSWIAIGSADTDDHVFNCIDIMPLRKNIGSLRINKVCWKTKAEYEREKWRILQGEKNKEIIDNAGNSEVILSTGSYYKLKVEYTIKVDEDKSDKPTLELFKEFPNFKKEINKYIIDDDGGLHTFSEKQYFQTSGPPQNLQPYVKWISPGHQSNTFFCEDDFVIRFNRDYLKKLYPDIDNSVGGVEFPYKLEAFIKDSEGKIIEGYFHNWTKSRSATLLPEEKEWYDYASKRLEISPDHPKDDILELRRYMLLINTNELGKKDWEIETLSPDNNESPKWKVYGNRNVYIANKVYAGSHIKLLKGGSLYITGEQNWTDYKFRFVPYKTDSTGALGAVFLYESKKNYYMLRIDLGEKMVYLIKVQEELKEPIVLASASLPSYFNRSRFEISTKKLENNKIEINVEIQHRMVIEFIDNNAAAQTGRVGFYSCGARGIISGIDVSSRMQKLKQKSRYELIVTGGEGGRTLFRDHFTNNELSNKWLLDNANTWKINDQQFLEPLSNEKKISYHKPVDDFEVIASIKLKHRDNISFLLRYPDEQREPSNQSYYELLLINRNNKYYSITLFNKRTDTPVPYEIEQKTLVFDNPLLIPIRIRMVGNIIKVWLFEKLTIDVKLRDYSRELFPGRFRPGVSGSRAAFDDFATYRITSPILDRVELPDGSARIFNYQTAYSGIIAMEKQDGNPQIKSFELREAELFKSSFTTSSFNSFAALISSYNNVLEPLSISSNTFTTDVKALIKSQQEMAIKMAVNYKKEVLFRAKTIYREELEFSKQEVTAAISNHNNNFLNFLSKVGDMAYQPLPERLKIYKVENADSNILGILVRSPEPLDPELFTGQGSSSIPSVIGRTKFSLFLRYGNNPSFNNVHTHYVTTGDGTTVFLYKLKNNSPVGPSSDVEEEDFNPDFFNSGDYKIRIEYIRDFEDDEKKKDEWDHMFDRPYVLSNSSKEKEPIDNIYLTI